ncbi:hypothetical protein PACTADRAFT_32661 [Pachysolen tannophilus NRRL Y-2460]|uniref:Nucleolar 27S pre-rRNA processing Urb2/Npa2 C-terminal domain-containing protein n=1 Tax=Pachysolen tannophilus NRRL Y-2460 TaxID=669874 RepID=A0A1E4TZT1_PACTA|nr:hypothetical protein PACTADRAFT_32661 [Pachysolen tannophilus NRRL Y-2460]
MSSKNGMKQVKDLSTAEGLTRFLRSKDIVVQQLIEISNGLLDDEYSSVLPNKVDFIFELLVDRLNDFKGNFKDFKLNYEIWLLFIKNWSNFSEEVVSQRNKIFKLLKISDIVEFVLKEIANDDNTKIGDRVKLLDSIMQMCDLVLSQLYLTITVEQGLNILQNYVRIIHQNTFNFQNVSRWTITINKMYNVSVSDKRITQKFTNEFSSRCLFGILRIISDNKIDETSKRILESIILETVLNKDNISFFKINVKTFLSILATETDTESSMLYLYKLAVWRINDVNVLQEVFILISDKFPTILTTLMSYLLALNRTLSKDFLSQLIEKCFISTDSNNYKLVSQILELNLELGVRFADKIFDLFILDGKNLDLNIFFEISSKVINCFARMRELEKLYEIWLGLIPINYNLFANDKFISLVSRETTSFSDSQLLNLLNITLLPKLSIETDRQQEEEEKENDNGSGDLKYKVDQCLIALITIVQSLFNSNQQRVNYLKPALFAALSSEIDLYSYSHKTILSFWRLKYLILCLYNDDDFEELNIEELGSKVTESWLESVSQGKDRNQYIYFTLFRLRELSEISISPQLIDDFIKYISDNRDDIELLKISFDRWLVFFNLFFSRDQIRQIVKIVLEDVNKKNINQAKEELWNQSFENEYIYEQHQIVQECIDQLIEIIAERKEPLLSYLELARKIPTQCFNRFDKIKLLNILYELSTKVGQPEIILKSLSIILNLLSQPTFKSNIESDIHKIYKLIEIAEESNNDFILNTILDIFTNIWKHNLNQHSDKLNEEWISNLLQNLTEFFNKFEVNRMEAKLPPEYLVCFVILTNIPSDKKGINREQLSNLSSNFAKSALSSLTTLVSNYNENEIVASSMSWLLRSLYEIDVDINNKQLFVEMKVIVRDVGKVTRSPTVKSHLFLLLCKLLDSTITESLYLMSLYVVLKTENLGADITFTDLDRGIENYLKKLDFDVFMDSLSSLLASFSEIEQNFDIYVSLLSIFLKNIHFFKAKDVNTRSQKLLTSALSTVSTYHDKLMAQDDDQDSKAILIVLNMLKSVLVDINWALTQYSFELIMSLVTKTIYSLQANLQIPNSTAIYVLSTQVVSNALLFHRFRLSGRHHLITSTFVPLMECLFIKNNKKVFNESMNSNKGAIFKSIDCATSFQRILSNLCEPPNNLQNNSAQLNSSSSLIKKSLRKHLPVLLINYVNFQSKYKMDNKIREEVANGITVIFDVLSQDELIVISASLDFAGRTYFRNLYDDYKKFGKWRDD